jgi:orotidine-5'-phosphate decarboxylase
LNKACDSRARRPNVPILIPGLGTQGGTVHNAIQNGANLRGEMAILNVSRSVLYASNGPDFAQAARAAAEKLRHEINDARNVSVAP